MYAEEREGGNGLIHVLIVEDESLVQELFRHYIEASGGKYVLADVTSDAGNAEMICQRRAVDLVLMDVCTANHASGLEAAEKIKKRFPQIKVIIVTSAPEYRFIDKAKKLGADSFWYKDIGEQDLLDIMDRTMAGEHIFPERTPVVTIGLAESDEFTATELRVLSYLADGLSSKSIADQMYVSVDTVNTHIKHLKDKTGCTSKTKLAVLASRSRLVLPEY